MSDWLLTEDPAPPTSTSLVLYGGIVARDSAPADIVGRIEGYAPGSDVSLASGADRGLVLTGPFVLVGMNLTLPDADGFEIEIREKNGPYLRTRKFLIQIVPSRNEIGDRFMWPTAATVD